MLFPVTLVLANLASLLDWNCLADGTSTVVLNSFRNQNGVLLNFFNPLCLADIASTNVLLSHRNHYSNLAGFCNSGWNQNSLLNLFPCSARCWSAATGITAA